MMLTYVYPQPKAASPFWVVTSWFEVPKFSSRTLGRPSVRVATIVQFAMSAIKGGCKSFKVEPCPTCPLVQADSHFIYRCTLTVRPVICRGLPQLCCIQAPLRASLRSQTGWSRQTPMSVSLMACLSLAAKSESWKMRPYQTQQRRSQNRQPALQSPSIPSALRRRLRMTPLPPTSQRTVPHTHHHITSVHNWANMLQFFIAGDPGVLHYPARWHVGSEVGTPKGPDGATAPCRLPAVEVVSLPGGLMFTQWFD